MGIFNRLGRNVERFKQNVTDAQSEEATHRCRDCDQRFFTDLETCSECGSEAVVAIESDGN
jgi:uncharacterized OB-fold protein